MYLYSFRVSWGIFLLHFLRISSTIADMKQYFFIFGFFCILVMPFSSYAESDSIIGSNLGLDFYSRIDDAGDTLAQGITKRRLSEMGTYGALGCNAPWLASEKIDQQAIERLREGNTAILVQIASKKKVDLTTLSESSLRQCLVEKYEKIQDVSHQDQAMIEAVWNAGLYTDGDVVNSDYDLLHDISRINGILFKSKYEYTGTKNASAKAISDMLAWKPIAPLFPLPVWGTNSGTTPPVLSGGLLSSSGDTSVWASSSWSVAPLPWAWVCSVSSSSWSSSSWWVDIDTLFGGDFFDTIDSSLAWGFVDGGFTFDTTSWRKWGYSASASAARFGISQKKDFSHTLPCEGIFCITLNMKWGTMNLLGGSQTPSIELLLEKHSKMMEPISWWDLSQQKMTNNTYQLPFLNVKFKSKIAGLQVFMYESPQQKKIIEAEATQTVIDSKFDRDVRCAMNEAWLPGWDMKLANGFIGAGYAPNSQANTTKVENVFQSLWATEMEDLRWCLEIRLKDGQKEANKGLSTDLNEIQSFTRSMLNIIWEILEVDRKFDNLPSK